MMGVIDIAPGVTGRKIPTRVKYAPTIAHNETGILARSPAANATPHLAKRCEYAETAAASVPAIVDPPEVGLARIGTSTSVAAGAAINASYAQMVP
jgi:hypothetical protein